MHRVVVVGNSGSGKTMLAAALATRLGVPHVELDAYHNQAGWQELPVPEFRARVAAVVAADGWVVDGNYTRVRDLVWSRADTVVWVDPPRRRVLRQIVWRSVSRAVLRRELWNGNRESWRNLVSRDPERSIIVWSWTRHEVYRQRYLAAMRDPVWAHLRFVRVASRAQARALLAAAGTPPL